MIGIECLLSKAGSASLPTPGFEVVILDDAGEPVSNGEQGNIAVKLPFPPSCLPTIWQDFNRFNESYLAACPGYYMSGDGGYLDEDGYLFVDDVINIAGHRMSTGRMEEVGAQEKILRKVMRKIANGDDVVVPSTIDDHTSLEDIYISFSRNAEST